MRARWIGVAGVTALALSLATGHADAARKYTFIKVTTPTGHDCANTEIDALNDSGTAVGSSYCGRDEAFVRTSTGAVSFYRLPAKDAEYTYGVDIASDGTMVVLGTKTLGGPPTFYLVSTTGQVTRFKDPKATKGHVTRVDGINANGDAVGFYGVGHGEGFRDQPFVLRHGKYKNFKTHKYLPRAATSVDLANISDSGWIGGTYENRYHPRRIGAFVISPLGHRRLIHVPAALIGPNVFSSMWRVLANGTMCGERDADDGRAKGFVVIDGQLHWVDPRPDAKKPFSDVMAVNSHGEVGGSAAVGRHRSVGFISQFG